jgi:iron(III) transport system substrate-binding protein
MVQFDRRTVLGALAAVASSPLRARAQAADPMHFTGPDREAKLLAGAKKEGTLTVYSSAVLEDMNAVILGFQKKYGVKATLWRGGSEEVLQRTVTEARGNRFDVDVVETASPQIEGIVRERLLADVTTPVAADIMPDAKITGRPWIPARLVVMTGAYNTRLIKPADLPKTYDDLVNPKWKGKLGIESDDNNWLMAMAGVMGEERAVKLLRDIVVKNGISVRKGHTLMANMVVSGEVPIALTIYHHEVEPMKRAGAPIAELDLAPEIAFVTGAAVARRAPHPNAAMLFLDYLLSEGQQILAARGTLPTNVKYQRLPPEWKLAFMDVPKYMDEAAKWTKLYKDTLTQPR